MEKKKKHHLSFLVFEDLGTVEGDQSGNLWNVPQLGFFCCFAHDSIRLMSCWEGPQRWNAIFITCMSCDQNDLSLLTLNLVPWLRVMFVRFPHCKIALFFSFLYCTFRKEHNVGKVSALIIWNSKVWESCLFSTLYLFNHLFMAIWAIYFKVSYKSNTTLLTDWLL